MGESTIDRLVFNAPYDESAQHWSYRGQRETQQVIQPGCVCSQRQHDSLGAARVRQITGRIEVDEDARRVCWGHLSSRCLTPP